MTVDTFRYVVFRSFMSSLCTVCIVAKPRMQCNASYVRGIELSVSKNWCESLVVFDFFV